MKFFGQILCHDPVQNCEIGAFREKNRYHSHRFEKT
jgi:hypothetical protein